jgi:serine/threonine-protein kinase RsbW
MVSGIVPTWDSLVVEARFSIEDITSVRPGQDAVVKLASRNVRQFGKISGTVLPSSPDTMATEQGLTYYVTRIKTSQGFQENSSMSDKQISFTLGNSISELDKLSAELESVGRRWQLAPKIVLQLNLVLDELFTNVVSYGFDNNSAQQVDLTLKLSDDHIQATMVDSGRPFDPTKPPDPELDLPLEEQDIGGLGIFLARKYVNDLQYRREGEKNIITLVKKTI